MAKKKVANTKKDENLNRKTIIKTKINVKKIVVFGIMIISIICIVISAIKLIKWNIDNNRTKKIMNDIENITDIKEVEEKEDNVEIIEQTEEIEKENPYWDYIKMNLITVDFKELKEKNADIVGWIQVNGTNINYPFVQTSNNEYYLNHSLDGSYTDAGWLFLDYRNDLANNDQNTIIYGHARLDLSMFGTLKNILKSGWLNDTNNYIIKLSTEHENTLWQVFSVYHIPTTSDYLYINFDYPGEFTEWTNKLMKRSAHNFNTTVGENDRVLTLSTCYSEDEKVVLHAKLIKREART